MMDSCSQQALGMQYIAGVVRGWDVFLAKAYTWYNIAQMLFSTVELIFCARRIYLRKRGLVIFRPCLSSGDVSENSHIPGCCSYLWFITLCTVLTKSTPFSKKAEISETWVRTRKIATTCHLVDYDVYYLVPYGEPQALLSCFSDCRLRYPGSTHAIIWCAFCEFESRQVN